MTEMGGMDPYLRPLIIRQQIKPTTSQLQPV